MQKDFSNKKISTDINKKNPAVLYISKTNVKQSASKKTFIILRKVILSMIPSCHYNRQTIEKKIQNAAVIK